MIAKLLCSACASDADLSSFCKSFHQVEHPRTYKPQGSSSFSAGRQDGSLRRHGSKIAHVELLPSYRPSPAFPRKKIAKSRSSTIRPSIKSVIKLRIASVGSKIGGASQRDMTDAPIPSSQQSASLLPSSSGSINES